MQALTHIIDDLLPQTQCQRCGFDGCRPYAEALAEGLAPINRCPPGGQETIAALARLLGRPELALDEECGVFEGLRLAVIDEQWCIGCTICIEKCPVDAIVGARKLMHTVIADHCTGCELCVQPCPTGCIEMVAVDAHPSRDRLACVWGKTQADAARQRHEQRRMRLHQLRTETQLTKRRRGLRRASRGQKRLAIEAAVRRAQARSE